MPSHILDNAVKLYLLKQNNKYANERFVNQEDDIWGAAKSFEDGFFGNSCPYIIINGSYTKVHIYFDPLFYVFLQNHVENGIDEYPENYDFKAQIKNYPQLF